MVARLGGGEGELAAGAAALGDDTVVVVEEFLEGKVCKRLWEQAIMGLVWEVSVGGGWMDRGQG